MATYFDTVEGDVASIFLSYFQRAPEFDALDYYVKKYDAMLAETDGESAYKDLAAEIYEAGAASGEVPSGVTITNAWYVDYLYQTVLGRAADEEGRTYWISQLDSGNIERAELVGYIIAGALENGGDDAAYLENRTEVAVQFGQWENSNPRLLDSLQYNSAEVLVGVNADPATVIAAQQKLYTATGPDGETFTLTTAPDNIVGTSGDDVVNGYIGGTNSTFTAADVINGGAGVDSLKLTVEAATGMPNAAVSNVEKFFIRDVHTAANTYDFSAINGETQVWADTATNDVLLTNLGAGTTVGLKGNNVLTNLGDVSFSMATATDAVSIAIDGGVKNTVAPTITNTTAGAATAATISSTGAANTVGAITLAAAGTNTVKTLTVNATTDLTAALVANDFAADAKLVVTGAGKVNLGANFDGATIDASGNSGGLTISTTNAVTKAVTGSSAADQVTLVGALTAAGTIDLGAGNDKLLAGAGAAIGAKNVIDGGAGVDSISASLINAANAAGIKNFELLDLSAGTVTPLDVELVTGSTITGLTLTGGAGGATLSNVAAGVGLSVSGTNAGTTTIGVKGAATGTADSFTTTFAGTAGSTATATTPDTIAAGTVETNGVESLNVVSGGTGFVTNTLAVTDSALQTLTITGDKGLALTFVGTNGTAVTGATDTVNGVKLIDGSAATGVLNIDTTGGTINVANAGLTVKTGAGNDVITLAQKATVDAGAGDDLITSAAAGGKFTGGTGNDKFDVVLSISTGITEATAIFSTITDFTAGDSVKLLAGNVVAGSTLGNKIELDASVTNIDTALQVTGLTDVANEVAWFQYGSDTYLVANDATIGFNAGDLVVKLTGLIDLSGATLDTATDYLTLA